MIEVVGHYIHPLVGSLDAALILESSKALLQLTALAKAVSASTSAKSTVAAASGWTPAAISGLLDLWDQQNGCAGEPSFPPLNASFRR